MNLYPLLHLKMKMIVICQMNTYGFSTTVHHSSSNLLFVIFYSDVFLEDGLVEEDQESGSQYLQILLMVAYLFTENKNFTSVDQNIYQIGNS